MEIQASNWSNVPELCCRRCATKSQWRGLFYSLCLGWWGLPWGLILTPIQIYRNLAGIFHGPSPKRPSVELEQLVRVGLAGRTRAPGNGAPAQTG